jgi:hypothetical protein
MSRAQPNSDTKARFRIKFWGVRGLDAHLDGLADGGNVESRNRPVNSFESKGIDRFSFE